VKRAYKIALAVTGALVGAQAFQCDRTNPPVTGDLHAEADADAVLRRAC
jgi:hypothetical protein